MHAASLKILFIINPLLERTLGFRVGDLLRELLDPALYPDPAIVYSEFPGHAKDLARRYRDKYQVIVAGGGDGTVNEIASQLIRSGVVLGILPMGSGKGLARSLHIPMDIRKAIYTLNAYRVLEMDTGLANQFRFINIAGIGFDAAVAHAYAARSGRGFFTYAWQTARNLFSYTSIPVQVFTARREASTRAFLLSIANASQWGYGARISPHALPHDGLLDLCIWSSFPRVLSPVLLFRLFNGSIHRSRYLDILRVREARINGLPECHGHIDGEPVQFTMPINIHVDPASLKVISGILPPEKEFVS
jgi:diacylglycerol kinase family enzyme